MQRGRSPEQEYEHVSARAALQRDALHLKLGVHVLAVTPEKKNILQTVQDDQVF